MVYGEAAKLGPGYATGVDAAALAPAQTAKDDPWWVAFLGIAVPILSIVGLIYFWPYSLFMLDVATLISIPSWLRRRPK